MKTNKLDDINRYLNIEDVPSLGSIITLDNKGRLINSQFSKPSSSQTLLKLNSIEDLPDADDLPYSIISYGDTLNIINLPYNDHNYCSMPNSKKTENYDKKALDYMSKQSSKSANRINFNANNSMRISHFSSYNPTVSQNDSIFFGDKYKVQNQFIFNQQISHSTMPVITNKTLSSMSQNNSLYSKNKLTPNTIVINSGSINKGKNMNVIQLRRPALDTNNINDTRVNNLPISNHHPLTNVMINNQINSDRDSKGDKPDLLKSINLIPRCICAFTHDDGGMIRCEICRTWQHIVCMYPDNKFPIFYKCERCEPREVDIRRAVTTQTNILIKTGYNPADFVVHKQYNDNDLDNDNAENNNFSKPNNKSHFVIVKPDVKTVNYRSVAESMHNTSMSILTGASKDSQTIPPGSPRTSKRKQDLISLKSVLSKPSTLNSNNFNSKNEIQKTSLPIETLTNSYNAIPDYFVPTSNQKLLIEQNESLPIANEMSDKLKYILSNRVQFNTNMTMHQQQYLRQNNFIINVNMYDVVLVDFTRYAVKTLVEFNSSEIIMEYNGFVSLTDEYNYECDFRKHYSPYTLFYDKFDHLSLCIDSKSVDNKSRYIRRSCTPNSEVKHRLLQDCQIRFYIVPINRISKDSEITIAFDFDVTKCRYDVECACNQPSCQLVYLKQEFESRRYSAEIDSLNINAYECNNINLGSEDIRATVAVTRPYKKRGRGSKGLISSSRPLDDMSAKITVKPEVNIVRRNKRGRPPLNRSAGLQRVDIVMKPTPPHPIVSQPLIQEAMSESSVSNHSFIETRDNVSDNESRHSLSNDNLHPRISIHNNFKNFKRISSSHWSLKTNRKVAALAKKSIPLKKPIISPKVGRPKKNNKKIEPVKSEQKIEYDSTYGEHNKPIRTTIKPPKSYYDEEYNDSTSPHSNKQDMSHDEEGKYWLQEINNKIHKQKVKEGKKIQKKSKYGRKKLNKKQIENSVISEPEITKQPIKQMKTESVFREETIRTPSPVMREKKELTPIVKKVKRGCKSQKAKANYILSYKPSNFDDLRNDLMLISASLGEDTDKGVGKIDEIKDEAFINEVIIEETVEQDLETIQHAEEHSFEVMEKTVAKINESDANIRQSELYDDRSGSSKSKRSSLNKSSDSATEMAAKASREERWVNTMWQRILKTENTDDKSKRRRSKSSAAEDSIASEDNRNDLSDLGSPKLSNLEMIEDRESLSKQRRKVKQLQMDHSGCSQDELSVMVGTKSDANNSLSTISPRSPDDHQVIEQKELTEQCGLIVYKEQQINPMEKFSRENSVKISATDNVIDESLVTANVAHAPHTKKRWLNQALMEETVTEDIAMPKSDIAVVDIMEKLSSIENVTKRSFLPPVFTSAENSDLNISKVAINPKKRLLNQFSMEDNALQAFHSSARKTQSYLSYKSSKSEPNLEQEQAKTKLTLSEYRKRRFIDKVPNEDTNVLSKYAKQIEHCNNNWVVTKNITPDVEKITDNEFNYCFEENSVTLRKNKETVSLENKVTNACEPLESMISTELSYIETLNNLPMPKSLDPRLSVVKMLHSPIKEDHDLRVIVYHDYNNCTNQEVIEPKSPSNAPDSDNEDSNYVHGPRTPSDNDLIMPTDPVVQNNCRSPGRVSVHSFESQPSPTSDSHFDLEKDINPFVDCDKMSVSDNGYDWTSTTYGIGKMAGIKHPDMLQEIDEFEDEYIPLPAYMPQRTKEELETLLLTQKRDSQIREWQEVKQLEREKVKLDHQVRSIERRLHRTNKPGTDNRLKKITTKKNPMADYDVKNDEKTMKTFNVQLANINGQLMAKINSLKMGDDSSPSNNRQYSRDRRKPDLATNGGPKLTERSNCPPQRVPRVPPS